MSQEAYEDLERTVPPRHRWKISAWLQDLGDVAVVSSDLQAAQEAQLPSLEQRALRVLRWLVAAVGPGRYFDLHTLGLARIETTWAALRSEHLSNQNLQRTIPLGWSRDQGEAQYLIAAVLCKEFGFLSEQGGLYQISPRGLLRLEGSGAQPSKVGFCAMWFSDEVRPLYDAAIAPAIRDAGYEPLRVDGTEHNGKIDDEIVASLRSARFVVADFTGHRGGVYYEAGFAHGLGLQVIFTCRENAIGELHFDVRQYNTIIWRDGELGEARNRLTQRILATQGRGPAN